MMIPPMECPTKLNLVVGPNSKVLKKLLSYTANLFPSISMD